MKHSFSRARTTLLRGVLLVAGFSSSSSGCGGRGGDEGSANPPSTTSALAVPAVLQPATNVPSATKVDLGRMLFWDPILSGGRDVACASCHHPSFAYADARQVSIGVGGAGFGPGRRSPSDPAHRTKRSSMTILDAALNGTTTSTTADPLSAPMFWDSRVQSLEEQGRGPISALDEMRGTSFDEASIFPELVARLTAVPDYAARFDASFGAGPISETRITQAIAAFERTLVDRGSSYDRYVSGDSSALTASQKRGYGIFNDSGCARCHSGPMFSDYALHRLGVPGVSGIAADVGAGGAFRTPSLRNVMRTAPYMHDGAFASLDAVFEFYDHVNRRLDPKLDDLRAPDRGDAADVKAFLGALSDGDYDATIPASVPSGLTPGGN